MATTKEIEEIFGLPSSKIDSWARSRDSNYLLVQFLKSFSSYDLETRLDTVLSAMGEEKKKPKEFFDALEENLTNCGITELEHFSKEEVNSIRNDDHNKQHKNLQLDFVTKINDKVYIFEFKKLLPSRNNLMNEIERMQAYTERFNWNLGHIFYLVNNKTIPSSITNDPEISQRVSIYNFDEITIKLFGKKIILSGSL